MAIGFDFTVGLGPWGNMVGWVELGVNFSGLGWAGSKKMDP